MAKRIEKGVIHLTKREIEVLRLLNEGKSNQTMADELDIQIWTLKAHLKRIYHKLGVSNRILAYRRAVELCVISS